MHGILWYLLNVISNTPDSSQYADPTVFVFMEETIADSKGKDESTDLLCKIGDFNARTANLSDIIENEDDLNFLNVNILDSSVTY